MCNSLEHLKQQDQTIFLKEFENANSIKEINEILKVLPKGFIIRLEVLEKLEKISQKILNNEESSVEKIFWVSVNLPEYSNLMIEFLKKLKKKITEEEITINQIEIEKILKNSKIKKRNWEKVAGSLKKFKGIRDSKKKEEIWKNSYFQESLENSEELKYRKEEILKQINKTNKPDELRKLTEQSLYYCEEIFLLIIKKKMEEVLLEELKKTKDPRKIKYILCESQRWNLMLQFKAFRKLEPFLQKKLHETDDLEEICNVLGYIPEDTYLYLENSKKLIEKMLEINEPMKMFKIYNKLPQQLSRIGL